MGFTEEVAWDVQHAWRTERLDEVEAELADIRGDLRTPDHTVPSRERPDALLRRLSSEPPHRERRTTGWKQQLTDIAAPPLPGRGAGLDVGPDLGF